MALTKVLIAIKTYPTLSEKYEELVCTAGFLEDGTMIRIYPIAFRKISYDQQYSKYDWIEIDLVKNTSDFRPESYRPNGYDTEIKVIGHLGTRSNWLHRKKVCLNEVHTNLQILISKAHDKTICKSLAVFKPSKILDFYPEKADPNWDATKLKNVIENRKQLNLFETLDQDFKIVKKLPYKFKFKFLDDSGKESNMMIEDWETGQLYWNCLKNHNGDEAKAVEDVRKKYFDDLAKTKDLFFFLGTTQLHHYVSTNPFMIIGTFHPKIETQLSLF